MSSLSSSMTCRMCARSIGVLHEPMCDFPGTVKEVHCQGCFDSGELPTKDEQPLKKNPNNPVFGTGHPAEIPAFLKSDKPCRSSYCACKQGHCIVPGYYDDRARETSKNTSTSILEEAQRIIYGDREKTYGSPDKNLKTIAKFWTEYIHATCVVSPEFLELSVDDVCMMMVLLKVARLANQPTHHDSLVDLAGYAALMERVQNYMKNK